MALQEHYREVTSFLNNNIVPRVGRLLEYDTGGKTSYSEKEEEDFINIIHKIIEEASSQPHEVNQFLTFKTSNLTA